MILKMSKLAQNFEPENIFSVIVFQIRNKYIIVEKIVKYSLLVLGRNHRCYD